MMRGYYDMLIGRADARCGRENETVRHLLHSRRSPRRAIAFVDLRSAMILPPSSTWWTPSSTNRFSLNEKSSSHHRWRLPRQSRTRRLGRRSALQRIEEGNDRNSEKHTTNNRMELTAAIEGLKSLREQCEVEVVTDSEYVKNGITTWIHGWKRKGWLTAAKKPVVNQDLWQALDEQVNRHKTTWTWTKGHANHADNNRCDELATRAAREQSSSS